MRKLYRPVWSVCTVFFIFLLILTLSPAVINDYLTTKTLIITSAGLFILFLVYMIRYHGFSELFNLLDEKEDEK